MALFTPLLGACLLTAPAFAQESPRQLAVSPVPVAMPPMPFPGPALCLPLSPHADGIEPPPVPVVVRLCAPSTDPQTAHLTIAEVDQAEAPPLWCQMPLTPEVLALAQQVQDAGLAQMPPAQLAGWLRWLGGLAGR